MITRLSSNGAMQAEAVRLLNELLDVAVTKAEPKAVKKPAPKKTAKPVAAK